MNDELLKDYYRAPRQPFTRSLRRRLAVIEMKTEKRPDRGQARSFAFAGLALVMVIVLTLFVIPAARAHLQDVIKDIGGILFAESGMYPGGPEAEITIVPSQRMSLAEANETLPFAIGLPQWLPEGYTLIDEVIVTDFAANDILVASVNFRSADPWPNHLSLNVHYPKDGRPWKRIIGPDSAETVQVNGQTAALVRGYWSHDTRRWENAENLSLLWQHQAITYELQSAGQAVSVEELIRAAESIR